jgi:hypothetical protein
VRGSWGSIGSTASTLGRQIGPQVWVTARSLSIRVASSRPIHPCRTEPDGKSKYSFAFKCHRDGAMIYSVNAIDAHPNAEYHVSRAWASWLREVEHRPDRCHRRVRATRARVRTRR